jgi:hyperosmotically inducible periplasmic protein
MVAASAACAAAIDEGTAMTPIRTRHLATLSVIAAAALLAACNKAEDDRTAGQKVDSAVAQVEQKAAEAKADMQEAGKDAKQATEQAADTATNKVKDIAITTAVNAELARDPALSSLRINVDTSNGRVALRGSAPDAESRERAAALAMKVDGVVAVENQLVVVPKG